MFAFTNVVHLFTNEFACLRAGRFSFMLVFPCSFQSFFFRHSLYSLPPNRVDAIATWRDGISMWPPQVQFARLLTIILSSGACVALAAIVLFLHAIFILWVALGAMFTRSRPVLRWLHIGSLCWGVLAELLPGTCPLTYLENWFESRAGIQPYQGGFLLHYLDKLVYPDISGTLLMIVAVIICSANLTFYALLWRLER
jgi:hypothetical protein